MSTTPNHSEHRSSMLDDATLGSRRYLQSKSLSTNDQITEEFSPRYSTNFSSSSTTGGIQSLNGSSLPADWISEATDRALLPFTQGIDKMYKKLYAGIASAIIESHTHLQSSAMPPQHLIETVRVRHDENKKLWQENKELLHREGRRAREIASLRSEIHALNTEVHQLRAALHTAENRALEVCTKYQAALEQGIRVKNSETHNERASAASASSSRHGREPETAGFRIPQTTEITVYRSSSRPNHPGKRSRSNRESFDTLSSSPTSHIKDDHPRPKSRLRIDTVLDHRTSTLKKTSIVAKAATPHSLQAERRQETLGYSISNAREEKQRAATTTDSPRIIKEARHQPSPPSIPKASSLSAPVGTPGSRDDQGYSPENGERANRALSFPPIASLEVDVQMDDATLDLNQRQGRRALGATQVDGKHMSCDEATTNWQEERLGGKVSVSPVSSTSSKGEAFDRALQRAPTPPWTANSEKGASFPSPDDSD